MTSDQISIEAYRQEIANLAAESGMARSRLADVDGFDEAIRIVRELAQSGQVFSADDVRGERVGSRQPGPPLLEQLSVTVRSRGHGEG